MPAAATEEMRAMEIEGRMMDDLLVLRPEGPRLDASGTVAFKDRMRVLTEAHEGRVMVDMTEIEFLDSSGLGALVAVMKTLGSGRVLELAGCAEPVQRVLALTRMDRVFRMQEVPAVPGGRDAA
jgi:anti-sigma B factor antagonist